MSLEGCVALLGKRVMCVCVCWGGGLTLKWMLRPLSAEACLIGGVPFELHGLVRIGGEGNFSSPWIGTLGEKEP